MLWVVTTNTNRCRIYQYQKTQNLLQLLKEIQHSESKLKGTDLLTDRPGHYQTRQAARGSYEPRTDAKDNEIDLFARMIAKELETARAENKFSQLILITPPQMEGILTKHLKKQITEKIIATVQKDYMSLKEHEMRDYLHENWLEIIRK